MKKIIRLKKSITKIITLCICVCILTACAFPAGNTKTVEEEVKEALEDQIPQAPEEEYVEENDSALEYVDVEDPIIEQPDVSIMTDAKLDDVPVEVSAADDQGNTESEVTEIVEDDTLQIVFIGDSIYDAVRDETGIAYRVGTSLDADVYNLAIGGTTAGLRNDKNSKKEEWNEPSFLGICYSMVGEAPESLLSGYKAGEIIKTCDFSKTDYFIIDYGTNDFLWYIPLGTDDYQGRYNYYFRSAYDMGIEFLQEHYPDAEIILCTPYYEEFWSADRSRFIGDIHSVNNGYGTLLDYISVVKDVARAYNLPCLNMYDLMEIDVYNVNDMTVDGIHPSEIAREKYANILVDEIKRLEEDAQKDAADSGAGDNNEGESPAEDDVSSEN